VVRNPYFHSLINFTQVFITSSSLSIDMYLGKETGVRIHRGVTLGHAMYGGGVALHLSLKG
jgi:hypothetical protein